MWQWVSQAPRGGVNFGFRGLGSGGMHTRSLSTMRLFPLLNAPLGGRDYLITYSFVNPIHGLCSKSCSSAMRTLFYSRINQVILNTGFDPRVRPMGRAAASPPCGVMDRDSTGETPSACARLKRRGLH